MKRLEFIAQIYTRKILLNCYPMAEFPEEIFTQVLEICSMKVSEKYTQFLFNVEAFTPANREKILDVLCNFAIMHDIDCSQLSLENREIIKNEETPYFRKCEIIFGYLK